MVRAECAEHPGAARALYVTAKEQRVVIVRAFIRDREDILALSIKNGGGLSFTVVAAGRRRMNALPVDHF